MELHQLCHRNQRHQRHEAQVLWQYSVVPGTGQQRCSVQLLMDFALSQMLHGLYLLHGLHGLYLLHGLHLLHVLHGLHLLQVLGLEMMMSS